ncbi:MAG: hypothetical protein ACI976_001192 [Aureispira sp.]|jgi:hypothetical protein
MVLLLAIVKKTGSKGAIYKARLSILPKHRLYKQAKKVR